MTDETLFRLIFAVAIMAKVSLFLGPFMGVFTAAVTKGKLEDYLQQIVAWTIVVFLVGIAFIMSR